MLYLMTKMILIKMNKTINKIYNYVCFKFDDHEDDVDDDDVDDDDVDDDD